MLEYRVTSFSEGKKGGQVTVTVGEGRNRRSFTRHLERRGYALIGLNIDEQAIPLNQKYEEELATAQRDLTSAETALAHLKKQIAAEEATTYEQLPELAATSLYSAMTDDVAAEEAALVDSLVVMALMTRAMDNVFAAEKAVADAEVKLDIVRREFPLMMEFRRY